MRDSFTQNGYGAPMNFNSFDNIAITKGPASVIDGPGAGVGGEVDFLTKRPDLNGTSRGLGDLRHRRNDRRYNIDVSGPIIPGELGVRVSYSGENS